MLLKVYLFLAVLSRCCRGFCLAAGGKGCSLTVAPQLLTALAPLAAERRLWGTRASVAAARGLSRCCPPALQHRLSSCGIQTLSLRGMWDLPGSGIGPCIGRWILYH